MKSWRLRSEPVVWLRFGQGILFALVAVARLQILGSLTPIRISPDR